jgi:prepilin-type N-terminal cleavage/methylation domain-containing protein
MKKYNGFTLVELMTVVAIIGILAMSTTTFIGEARTNSTSRSIGNAMWLDITFARSHAISNDVTVTIDPVDQTAGAGANWALGWQVNTTDKDDLTNTPFPIKTQSAFRNGSVLRSTGANTLDKNTPITFTADGMSTTPGALTGSVSGCFGENGRTVQINQIGQVISTKFMCP